MFLLGKANYNMLTSPAKEETKITNNGSYGLMKLRTIPAGFSEKVVQKSF
jgi:hypothetical protein